MNTLILCLNSLLLLMTLNPVSIAQMINVSLSNRRMQITESTYMVILLIVYGVLFGGVALLAPGYFQFTLPTSPFWYLVGVVAGPVIILVEIGIGYLLVALQGKRVARLSKLRIGGTLGSRLAIIGVGLLEELIYRQLWFVILLLVFEWPTAVVLLVTGIFYGVNHVTLGWKVCIQKCISGLLFGVLFIYSGFSILIPLIAHGIQNSIIVGRGE